MTLLTASEIEDMSAIQVMSLHDKVTLLKSTVIKNDYGTSKKTKAEVPNVNAGFKVTKLSEALDNAEVTILLAKLRLAKTVDINGLDEVVLTHRYYAPITPITFKVDGTPIIGATGIEINLVRKS